MPYAPPRPCTAPGCPELSTTGRCPTHTRAPWTGSTAGKRTSTPAWKRTRSRVLRRDRYRCYACGRPAAEVDHVIAVTNGGSDDDTNLAAICTPCHLSKSGREGAHARWAPAWGHRVNQTRMAVAKVVLRT